MSKILQLKISLEGIAPKIWRRFLVKENATFQELHNTIQAVMGWGNYHMFEFQINDICISPDEEGHNPAENSLKRLYESPEFIKMLEQTKLKNGSASLDIDKVNKILKEQERNKKTATYKLTSKINILIHLEKQRFNYIYDFGDNWKHFVVVEKILDSADAPFIPFCLSGERSCPPEDCGSIPEYYELQKIKKNKNRKEYKERIAEWLGEDFDFEYFDLNKTNKELHRLAKIDGRIKKWRPK
ncbi:plasmid pRiA4b ORF-3 family protein [Candidatus Woesearchaeota archaeon]|nr:plasmid pRiA4b ORF-3 family protein [Candidatus Woesearchaeota archaeon]